MHSLICTSDYQTLARLIDTSLIPFNGQFNFCLEHTFKKTSFRCLDKLDKTLDNKHLHAVKHEISQHLEGVQNAAKNGKSNLFEKTFMSNNIELLDQYDCILPRLEALLAVLNNFQERIITNLQSNEKQPKQPPPPFEPIRPIFGGGPGGGGMIGNLLEEASQNNSPGFFWFIF